MPYKMLACKRWSKIEFGADAGKSSAETGQVKKCSFICGHENGEFEGTVTLPDIDPLSSEFIAYEDITEETARQWLFDTLGDERALIEEVAGREPSASAPVAPEIVTGTPWT